MTSKDSFHDEECEEILLGILHVLKCKIKTYPKILSDGITYNRYQIIQEILICDNLLKDIKIVNNHICSIKNYFQSIYELKEKKRGHHLKEYKGT